MKCPYCGKILPNSAKYCGGCGSDLTSKESFLDRFLSSSPIRKVILLILAGAARELVANNSPNPNRSSDESVFDQINPATIFSHEDEDTYVSGISEIEDANPENESSTVTLRDAESNASAYGMNISRNSFSYSY